MLLARIYDEDLAQASYFIGCQAKGEAIVVDPRRDLDVYLQIAAKNGMTITAVTETHIHADYLSGTRELAAATGAKMYVSDEGGPDWAFAAWKICSAVPTCWSRQPGSLTLAAAVRATYSRAYVTTS